MTWEELDRPCSERAVDHALACAAHRIEANDDERAVLVHGDVHQWNALETGAPLRYRFSERRSGPVRTNPSEVAGLVLKRPAALRPRDIPSHQSHLNAFGATLVGDEHRSAIEVFAVE